MGEKVNNIFKIGSPDVDIILKKLAKLKGDKIKILAGGGISVKNCKKFKSIGIDGIHFSIDKNRQDDDLVFVVHDVEVVVDEMSLELINDAELDYVQDLMGSYFAVINPNATASCGCGTSFSI